MLEEKVKKYGITQLAADLGLCELSARNKISGKAKITPPEMLMIQNRLDLSDEEMEELRNAQSKYSSTSI